MSSAYFLFSLASRRSVIYLETICQPMALKRKVGKDKVQYLSPMPEMEQSQCSLLTALSPEGREDIFGVDDSGSDQLKLSTRNFSGNSNNTRNHVLYSSAVHASSA
jgi:hypothetical protein